MAHISIIGTGNMGQAIAAVAGRGGHGVQLLGHTDSTAVTGDVVVLAVPYPAVADVLAARADQLDGKIVVDITNPLNFETFDSLTVPADASATAEIAAALPGSRVLKAFNTTFAATLASGAVGDLTTTVLIAAARPRARGHRLPADHPRRRREDLLDRRLRRRSLTHPQPTTTRENESPP